MNVSFRAHHARRHATVALPCAPVCFGPRRPLTTYLQPSGRAQASPQQQQATTTMPSGRTTPTHPQSLFEMAAQIDTLQGPDADVLRRIFRVTSGSAQCSVGPQLSAKYNMAQDNTQLVCSVTNLWTLEQAWFNEVRSRKPQTFTAGSRPVDPTGGGGAGKCDFCDWNTYTASDPWGRIDAPHAVTASNLFKYGEPYHGLALFKHHDPLSFTLEQLTDLMKVSAGWFAAAAHHYSQHYSNANTTGLTGNSTGSGSAMTRSASAPAVMPKPLHAFFIWNALARAGASQYHGHAQLMATSVPVPTQAQLDLQAERYQLQHPGSDYVRDLLRAHGAVGLLRACAATPEEANQWKSSAGVTNHSKRRRAWVAASLSPIKDMEVLVAVEPDLGHSTQLVQGHPQAAENGQHPAPSSASGLTDPAFCRALHATLRTLIDTLGVESFNVGILNVPHCDALDPHMNGDGNRHQHTQQRPLMLARVVSRGRMSQPASDFGCLEVIGGASIGHTDPYRVISAVETHLGDCLIDEAVAL